MERHICGFCGVEESDENPLILGNHCAICSICVVSAYTILFGEESDDINKHIDLYEHVDLFEGIRKKNK